MILRDKSVVFVHVPKAAGTTIEFMLDGKYRQATTPTDYDVGWGWCHERRVWLQHLTAVEMIEHGLITAKCFEKAFSFAVVRNPFDRAVSDYFFLRQHVMIGGSFREMIERRGKWQRLLTDRSGPRYRGDHLRPQVEYVYANGEIAVDHVGRMEQLDCTVEQLYERGLVAEGPVPVRNAGVHAFAHYSHFYEDDEIALVAEHYGDDLSAFGYSFEDRRHEVDSADRTERRRRAERAAARRAVRVAGAGLRDRLGLSQ